MNAQSQWVRFPALLKVPSFNRKLSGSAGQVLLGSFQVGFDNPDGHADSLSAIALPVHLSKSVVDNPALADFNSIGEGFIENVQSQGGRISIKAGSVLRNMD
ncbi:MAG: hypothetical protein AAF975_07155, partial [Spirochaetota bacterium]